MIFVVDHFCILFFIRTSLMLKLISVKRWNWQRKILQPYFTQGCLSIIGVKLEYVSLEILDLNVETEVFKRNGYTCKKGSFHKFNLSPLPIGVCSERNGLLLRRNFCPVRVNPDSTGLAIRRANRVRK